MTGYVARSLRRKLAAKQPLPSAFPASRKPGVSIHGHPFAACGEPLERNPARPSLGGRRRYSGGPE